MKFPYHWLDPEPFPNYDGHVFGTLDIRVFWQDELWVDVAGKVHLLEEMNEEYLFGVLKHLFQHCEYFYSVVFQWYLGSVLKCAVLELSGTDPALLAGFREDFETFLQRKTPHEWLNHTPLVQKLNSLLDQKDSVPKSEN